MVNGASSMLDLPIIDGDFMGRAYPTGWQTTCNVFDDGDEGKQLLPSCTSSGDGVEMVRLFSTRDSTLTCSLVPDQSQALQRMRLSHASGKCRM